MRSDSRGFSLLEVIISLAIASAALIIIIQTFTGGFRARAAIEQRSTAALAAQSLMTEIKTDFKIDAAPLEGRLTNGDYWRAHYRPLPQEPFDHAQAWWITISVFENAAPHADSPYTQLTGMAIETQEP